MGFNTYSTFAGKIDWKFTHKNHFYLAGSPFSQSRQTVLNRQITFQGQTFLAGSTIRASLDSNLCAPGYQYDIIRRKRGHLGIGVQVDLFDSSAKISAVAQVVDGQPQPAVSARVGPGSRCGSRIQAVLDEFPKLFVEGNVYGMYFGGYGNFVSSSDTLGVTVRMFSRIRVPRDCLRASRWKVLQGTPTTMPTRICMASR